MTKLYKLTTQDFKTRAGEANELVWGKNITHKATGSRTQPLCSDGYIHAYEHPLLAILLNPIHADYKNPVLWEGKGSISKRDGQLKVGCRSFTTVRALTAPAITHTQTVAFGILCALAIYKEKNFNGWATKWLTNKNRSLNASDAASDAAFYAANAANAAFYAAAYAAEAASSAAHAAHAASHAANAAAYAAADAAYAADAAVNAKVKRFDLIKLAQRAMKVK